MIVENELASDDIIRRPCRKYTKSSGWGSKGFERRVRGKSENA